MEQLEIVFLTTIVVAVLCISFSTWVTLSDLRSTVFESEAFSLQSAAQHGPVPGGALQSFAHHAAEHLPHGIKLSGKSPKACCVPAQCSLVTGDDIALQSSCRYSTRPRHGQFDSALRH